MHEIFILIDRYQMDFTQDTQLPIQEKKYRINSISPTTET